MDQPPDLDNRFKESPTGADRNPSGLMLQRRQHHMGTWLEISIWADDQSRAMTASEAAFAAVADADRRLSTWRQDSELAAVNDRGRRRPVALSSLLVRDLSQALGWHRETDGAFSPGLGTLVSAWDLRGAGRAPTYSELHTALADSALDGTIIDDNIIRFGQAGLQFEEGGFGKGVALRDGATAALESGARCVILDFGGQIAVCGDCGTTAIAVSEPTRRQHEVGVLSVAEASVATSGLSERGFVIDGIRYGHILDPRTGRPVRDWGAVTVVTPDPVTADCLSTALFVMGPETGATWVSRRPGIEAVFSENIGGGVRLNVTAGLQGRFTPSPGTSVEWISMTKVQRLELPASNTRDD